MKKVSVLILGFFITAASFAQTADEVLQNYFDVIGQHKVSSIQTMTATGKSQAMGMELPFKQVFKRPDKIMLEVDIQGSKMLQVYNGKTGWMTAPWTGSTEPIDITGPQLEAMKVQADLDGQLYNWKEKGYEMDFKGKEDFEGAQVYKIMLTDTLKNSYMFLIDAETYILIKSSTTMTIQGNEITSDTFFSNYKEVEGMLLPHSVENKVNGQTQMVAIMEKYVFNETIDDSVFEKPVAR